MNKSIQERIAALQKEQEQLKARAQKLQSEFNEKERKTTNHRKYVIGAIILKDIETNAGLRNHVCKLLAGATKRDKKVFPDLLPPGGAEANQS